MPKIGPQTVYVLFSRFVSAADAQAIEPAVKDFALRGIRDDMCAARTCNQRRRSIFDWGGGGKVAL